MPSVSELERDWDIAAAAVDDAWRQNPAIAAEDAVYEALGLTHDGRRDDLIEPLVIIAREGYTSQLSTHSLRDLRDAAQAFVRALQDIQTRDRMDHD